MQDQGYVLYVDDEVMNLEVFKGVLDDEYQILTASTTIQAYEYLKTYPVKVLISDQRMPDEDGLTFLKRVKPEFPDVIQIIFTAYLDHEAALGAINQGGIFRYILKPWNTSEIRHTLNSAFREHHLLYENKRLFNELQSKNKELSDALKRVSESEYLFYEIFSSNNDGIVIIKDYKIEIANPTFKNITGFNGTGAENFSDYIRHNHSGLLSKIKSSAQYTICETEIDTPDGKKYIEFTSRYVTFGNTQALLAVVRDVTERKQVEKRILEAVIRTQEEDKSRYARELHDGLGPILSTLKMYVEWMSDPANVTNKELIAKKSIENIDGAIEIVREIANNLSPHVLQNFGLVNAVQTFADQIKGAKNIEIHIVSNVTSRLPEQIEITLYRIITECINNTLKHADARKISIKFKQQGNRLTIFYSDNGKGFNYPETLQQTKGMGLLNMQNRMNLLGGEMRFNSNINIGTDIEINLTF